MLKGKCKKISESEFIFTFLKDKPIEGRDYILEDLTEGTNAQNSLFHEILQQFYKWMLKTDTFIIEDDGIIYDLRCSDWYNLKDKLKAKYGKGFSKIKYADIINEKPKLCTADSFNDLPMHVREDFKDGNRERVEGKLVSWADYSKNQRRQLLDITLLIMDKFCVDSNDYIELREELGKKSDKYLNKLRKKFI